MRRLPPPPEAPPLPPRDRGRKRRGWNDPPLSATPKERARLLACLEEFKVGYDANCDLFTAYYEGPASEFICFMGTPLPPEEAI